MNLGILPIVAGLFLIGALFNVYLGIYVEAIGGFCITIIILFVYYILRKEDKENHEFVQWLLNNNGDIISNKFPKHKGIPISSKTELRQYKMCFSFLIVSVKVKSKFFVKEYHFTPIISMFFSLLTIVFGWWGLPWGPIYTIQALLSNFTGGKKITVRDSVL